MEHDFLDKYARQDGFLQRLSPEVKILSTLIIIIAVVSMSPSKKLFIFSYILITALIFVSNIPPTVIVKRILLVMPFTLLVVLSIIATDHTKGIQFLIVLLSRSIIAISAVILLTATTQFPSLLRGLQQFGTPKVIIMVLSFLYRYIFLVQEELMRISRARKSRTIKHSTVQNIRQAGTIIGELFIRSFERSERVYAAMLARGFEGEFNKLK